MNTGFNSNISIVGFINRSNNTCFASYQIMGLENNHGNTMGNMLRRTILSSTPGLAIYAIHVSCFKHEFDSSASIQEDANMVMHNIKDVIVKYNPDVIETSLSFKFQGPLFVNAGMFESSEIKILNKSLHIMHISEEVEVTVQVFVRNSCGFSMHNENVTESQISDGMIGVTAVYSKIMNINYKSNKDVVNDKLDNIDLTIEYYDIYSDKHFILKNALMYCASMNQLALENLEKYDGVVYEEEDEFQKKKRLMNLINTLKTDFGIALVMYISNLTFNSIEELIGTHLSDVNNYKVYGIKKKQYKELIERLRQLEK